MSVTASVATVYNSMVWGGGYGLNPVPGDAFHDADLVDLLLVPVEELSKCTLRQIERVLVLASGARVSDCSLDSLATPSNRHLATTDGAEIVLGVISWPAVVQTLVDSHDARVGVVVCAAVVLASCKVRG